MDVREQATAVSRARRGNVLTVQEGQAVRMQGNRRLLEADDGGPVPLARWGKHGWALNRAACRLLDLHGADEAALLASVHSEDRALLADLLAQASPRRVRVRTIGRPERTLQLDLHGSPSTDPVVSFADVTELAERQEWLAVEAEELKHRIGNLFAVVAGLARMGRADEADLLANRVQALGVAQAALDAPGGMTVDRLCRAVLAPFWQEGRIDIRVCCTNVHLPSAKATPIALALNELATNAVKHGALATAGGRLQIWITADARCLRLDWVETGIAKARGVGSGFGTRLLTMSIERQLRGKLERVWTGEGLTTRIEIPIEPGCCCARATG